MMKLWEVFRFEVRHQLRRRSMWLYVAALLALVFHMVREMTTGENGDILINAPAALFEYISLAGLFGLVVTAALAGDAATRDVQARMESLLYTAPVGKWALLGGRFLGVLVLNALLLAVATGVVALAVHTSDAAPERLGPFRAAAYVGPYVIAAFPNVFIGSVLLFVAALVSRRAFASYVAGAVLFVGVQLHLWITAEMLGRYGLAAHLDPLGFIASALLFRSWTPIQENALLVPFEGWLASNRLLWLGIAAAVGLLAAHRFRLAHHAPGAGLFRRTGRRQPATDAAAPRPLADAPIAVPHVPRSFGGAVWVRQTVAVAGRAFRQLVGGWGWVPLVAIALLQVLIGPELMEHLGVPLLPTTARVVDLFGDTSLHLFVTALLIFYAGELVWGDREAGQAALVDAAPVPDGVLLLGRLLALGLVIVAVQGLMMAAGLAVQVLLGYTDVEPGLYLGMLFGLQLADYALFAVLAFAVHVLVDQKYVGHLVALALYAFTFTAALLGVKHHLLAYGAAPAWAYAELTGFGASLRPFLLFKLYWTGWALLLAAAAWVYRVRGVAHGLRERHGTARRGVTPGLVGLAVVGGAVVVLAGGFVFYNTNVLNEYHTDEEVAARQAEYELRYGRYEGVPQPHVTAADLRVELYPERREATVRGTYRLVNETGTTIDTLHVATSLQIVTESVTFDQATEPVRVDDDLGHRVYRLARPLLPGDTLRMGFAVRYAPRGFTNGGAASQLTQVVERGVSVRTEAWLPRIGFQQDRILTSVQARGDHGLPPRPVVPPLGDEAARYDRNAQPLVDLDVTVGTAGDQMAVAPGALVRTWTEDGRRYVRYVTDAPVSADFAILSAHYAVREGRWENPAGQDVQIQVFYQPGRDENVERFIRAAQATLATLSERLGPYPHRQLKIVASPEPGLGASAFSGLITVRDGLAAMLPDEDPRDVDFAFAVMAHEVAHQWWGHRLVPALVEGAPLLTESLAWYSAMDVVEDALGPDHLERLMGVMRQAYLAPKPESGVPLLRAVEYFDAYRKGPFAMYALREYVGERPVNAALRRLLAEHSGGEPPLPTSLDLYRELQAVTPDTLHYLLADLFERNTFWDLATDGVTVEPTGTGAWRVTLDVRARKVAVDSVGVVTEMPMDDLVEVGVFAAGEGEDTPGAPLYQRLHRVRSGGQRITVLVPRQPARVEIDPRHLLIDPKTHDNAADVRLNL